MSPAPSSSDSVPVATAAHRRMEDVEAVMAIHRATLAKLVANGFSPLVAEFLEDAAATYQLLAARLREPLP
jgi:hypothetical protein